MKHSLLGLLLLLPSAGASTLQADLSQDRPWGPEQVELLLHRAGFGASADELAFWTDRPRAELIEHLLAPAGEPLRFEEVPERISLEGLEGAARRRATSRQRKLDRDHGQAFLVAWLEHILAAERPLEERMTLFWHGFFTSEQRVVKKPVLMIEQNRTLRAHALGSYADLLQAMLRDPALLIYLDNDTNKRDKPNENLAREVMELFSLGEGHYTERDVRQAARALTGNTVKQGQFRFHEKQHDDGRKKVLGVRGRHRAEDLAEILLEQPACAEWVAGRLIAYFEGTEPTPQRLADYADFLRSEQYELRPFLRRLFEDPAFYASAGTRVSSPLDYLVGLCRRTGVEPPAHFLFAGADLLGQTLFDPPNVKGWEEGLAWIHTGAILTRANLAGALIGTVSTTDLADQGARARKTELAKVLRALDKSGYGPDMHFGIHLSRARAETDEAIVDELAALLLPTGLTPASRSGLLAYLGRERARRDIADGEFLVSGPEVESILRRLAHLILCLPEAHLS